jgi:hypothetical protein
VVTGVEPLGSTAGLLSSGNTGKLRRQDSRSGERGSRSPSRDRNVTPTL